MELREQVEARMNSEKNFSLLKENRRVKRDTECSFFFPMSLNLSQEKRSEKPW